MRPRMLIGKTICIGGLGLLCLSSSASAGDFEFHIVFDSSATNLAGESLTYLGSNQIVVGNGGVVGTISSLQSGDSSHQFVTYNASYGNAATQIIARPGNTGTVTLSSGPGSYDPASAPATFDPTFGDTAFTELALSQTGGTNLTFIGADSTNKFGLFQANISGSTITPSTIEHNSTYHLQSDGVGIDISSIHHQANVSGQVAYIRQDSSGNSTIVRTGASPLQIDSSSGLQDFGVAAGSPPHYNRVAVAADGSVVFRATRTIGGSIGIYRSNDLVNPVVPVTDAAVVLGASNDRVLYSDIDAGQTNLTLTGVAAPLASYASQGGPRNAVMTQKNRVAFFNPDGGGAGVTSVGYYSGSGTSTTSIAVDNATTVSDGTHTFLVTQIDPSAVANPMVNDRGTVVFNASLVPTDASEVSVDALLAWEASDGVLRIVVKASSDIAYADQVGGVQITGLGFDTQTNQAGDVLKDALSEDNWLAFEVALDNGTEAVLSVAVPEPTSLSIMGLSLGGMLVRRRRRR